MQNKKTRLLFVNGHLNAGGVEKSLTDLLCNMNYSVYDIDVLLLESRGSYCSLLPPQVRILSKVDHRAFGPLLKTTFWNLIHFRWRNIVYRFTFTLSSICGTKVLKLLSPVLGLRKKYDCAIAYRIGMPNLVVSVIANADRKLCWWHNGECHFNQEQAEEVKRLWNKMSAIVAVSEGCKQMLVNSFSISSDKINVIPNIIDVERIEKLAGDKSPYGNTNGYIFVTLGRLCWEKHVEDVPEIAHCLLESSINNFKWYIIGDGVKREEIANKIKFYGLENRVEILGYQANPYPYIKFASILIHTSHIEAHCLTILEAMALRTPCVATQTNIPQDFVEDGVNCLIAEQNIKNQVKQIIRLMSNKEAAMVMVENAYDTVKHKYCPSTIIPLVESMI